MAELLVYKVAFTCPSITDEEESYNFSLTSANIDDTTSFPILKGITGLGAEVNELVPTDQRGQITITDIYESLGSQRRFSDMLQRYAFVNQDIKIYVSQTNISQEISFDLFWSGKIASAQVSYDREIVTLTVVRSGIRNTILTQEVTTDNYPNAPEQSIGKVVPLILGYSQQVTPILIDTKSIAAFNDWNTGKYDAYFAYGTNFANQFQNYGIKKVNIRGNDNYYRRVNSAIDVGSEISIGSGSSNNCIAAQFLSPNAGDNEPTQYYSRSSWEAKQSGVAFQVADYGVAIVGLEVKFFQHNTDTYSVALTAWNDEQGYPKNQIASVTRLSTDAESLGTVTDHDDSASRTLLKHQFIFDAPVVVAPNERVYFTIALTDDNSTTPIKIAASYSHSAAYSRIEYWDDDLKKQTWVYTASNRKPDAISIYGLDFIDLNKGDIDNSYLTVIDGEVDANGFGSSKLLIAYGTDNNNFSWNDLGIVIEADGLGINNSGTVSTPKYKPAEVNNILFRVWDGDSWELQNYNSTAFNDAASVYVSGHELYRTLSGVFTTRTTLKTACETIARNAFGKFVPVLGEDNNIGFYGYGNYLPTSFELTDDDCSVDSIEIVGTESIINRALILYAPLRLTSDRAFVQSGFTKSYDSDSIANVPRDVSKDLYGACELADNQFTHLYTSGFSAIALAKCYIERYSQPSFYINISAPYEKIKDRKLMQVGYISSPQVPAFWGSSGSAIMPDGTQPLAYDNIRRAARYRVQIEGFNISLDNGQLIGKLKLLVIYGGNRT